MNLCDETSKFNLCVLPTQLGKTFTTIKRIVSEIEQDGEFGRSVHFVFTMNTLLNNSQFAIRLGEVEQMYGKGSVCVLASKYNGKYKHVTNLEALKGLCYEDSESPRVIVMCSNNCRYADAINFIHILNTKNISGTSYIKRVFAYYDELHKYISGLREQIEEIHNLDICHGILALTATPHPIWETTGFWSNIHIINLEFNDSNYAGYLDMIFNCNDNYDFTKTPNMVDFDELDMKIDKTDRKIIGYIEHTLMTYPKILENRTRTFIPVYRRRAGHNLLREYLFKLNKDVVVVVLNGIDKNLQFKNSEGNIKTIPLSSNDIEVCEMIYKVIEEFKLQERPLVITGFLCVGMGQTLTHESLGSFTSAIFSHLDLSNDEIYQLFGRITGRMKKWRSYCKTNVYCPTAIMHRCICMEECARHIAIDHSGKNASNDDYTGHMNLMGEAGQTAISNFRPDKKEEQRIKKEKIKEEKNNKEKIKEEKRINKDKIKEEKRIKKEKFEEEKRIKVEKKEKNMRVPVIINISKGEISKIPNYNHDEKKKFIFNIVKDIDEKLYKYITNTAVTCKQITTPIEDGSYKRHVIDIVNKNKPCVIDLEPKDKEKNNWQLFIDNRENRLCFVIWVVDELLY